MNRLIGLTALVVGMSAATAFAQAPAEPSPLPPAPPEINNENPRSRPPLPHGEPTVEKSEMKVDGGPGQSVPRRERGARFHIEDGQTRIDLRCGDDASTKECGDLLLQILDRVKNPSPRLGDSGRGSDRDRSWDDRDRDYRRDRDERR